MHGRDHGYMRNDYENFKDTEEENPCDDIT